MGVYSLTRSGITNWVKYSTMSAGNEFVQPDYELISTTLITTNTASVTFDVSSFAGTYKHLQVRVLAKSSTTPNDSVDLTFNTDTANNYSYHAIYGNGSSIGSESAINAPSCYSVAQLATSSDANQFGASIVDILDAFSASKYKTIRSIKGAPQSSGNLIQLVSGNWRNTAAIASVKLTARASNFAPGSRLSIYGLKG